jgi:hypothetical protein
MLLLECLNPSCDHVMDLTLPQNGFVPKLSLYKIIMFYRKFLYHDICIQSSHQLSRPMLDEKVEHPSAVCVLNWKWADAFSWQTKADSNL